ncbi:cysteine--tRNA ligase [Aestuariibius sp. 2305UL40-4]|uniref:cysteine--tRNA ligase n=1 Tax=Aestuariibius violaceus TaxID=3234132 RepID=UPI00345F0913
MGLTLYNTKTRRKEPFAPLDPENVRMYVCGPTVYDRAHLGNARPVLVFDVLYRLLRHLYPKVTYVRNFTDVDDKINATALARKEAGAEGTLEELVRERSDETIRWYHEDMEALGALRPDHEPRATAYIGQMIAMIEALIANGHAYAAEGHVLFSVDSYGDYGALSGRTVEDMIAGARVEVAPYKRDPMDFVLWKPSTDELPGWESPWGRGRPGWHIECSAMAYELLGDTFDIHGGGIDLQFPHHENEIAQSKCAGHGFAKVWMHNEMLQVEGKKMSKSLGNFFTVRDLLDQGMPGNRGVPGPVIRFVFLRTHYRKPMNWRQSFAIEARKKLDLWALEVSLNSDLEAEFTSNRDAFVRHHVSKDVVEALCDDLNTPLALSHISRIWQPLEGLNRASLSYSEIMEQHRRLVASCFILGIDLFEYARENSNEKIDLSEFEIRLQEAREAAIETKDFSAVDALKAMLVNSGAEVRMSKAGVQVIAGPNFDPSKLEVHK